MPSVKSNPYVPYVDDTLPRGLIQDVVNNHNVDRALDYAVEHHMTPHPENASHEKLKDAVEYRCYQDARDL